MRNKDQHRPKANASQLSTSKKKNSPPQKPIKHQSKSANSGASPSTSCSKCGATKLVDITSQEFPGQTSLVFECVACGNHSMRSNISDEERRRRLLTIADDHLSVVECQFCRQRYPNRCDYVLHLQNDHGSNQSK